MRALIAGSLTLALVASCGSGSSSGSNSNGGSGGGGSTQVGLKINTTGNGLVRGVGADCRGSCTTQLPVGTQVHLVAVPDSGASFVAWSGACSGTGGCDLTLDADREVSATFASAPLPPPDQRRLTVTVTGSGQVKSSPPGLSCDSSTCSANFTAGASITLTATASSGFTFAGWGGDCSGSGECIVSLSQDGAVSASFVSQPPPPAQVRLSASVNGPGTVTGGGLDCGASSSTCEVMVASGTAVTLTASPANDARFASWGGACSGTSTNCDLTLRADVQVTAEFQPQVMVLIPQQGGISGPVALNSTHVLWSQDRSIWSIPKTGGTARLLVNVPETDGFPSTMVADEAFIYWSNGSDILSSPTTGGQASHVFTATSVGPLVIDERGAVYWAANDSPDGSIFRLRDGVGSQLAKDQQPGGAIAVDATHVYYYSESDSGVLRRVPRDGGPVEKVFSCAGCYIRTIRVDPQNIYFRSWTAPCDSNDGFVHVLSKSDFSARAILTGNGGGDCLYYGAMDVNSSVVYWAWEEGATPYGIFRANADGSGFAAIETDDHSGWPSVFVDDQAIYYSRRREFVRRLK